MQIALDPGQGQVVNVFQVTLEIASPPILAALQDGVHLADDFVAEAWIYLIVPL